MEAGISFTPAFQDQHGGGACGLHWAGTSGWCLYTADKEDRYLSGVRWPGAGLLPEPRLVAAFVDAFRLGPAGAGSEQPYYRQEGQAFPMLLDSLAPTFPPGPACSRNPRSVSPTCTDAPTKTACGGHWPPAPPPPIPLGATTRAEQGQVPDRGCLGKYPGARVPPRPPNPPDRPTGLRPGIPAVSHLAEGGQWPRSSQQTRKSVPEGGRIVLTNVTDDHWMTSSRGAEAGSGKRRADALLPDKRAEGTPHTPASPRESPGPGHTPVHTARQGMGSPRRHCPLPRPSVAASGLSRTPDARDRKHRAPAPPGRGHPPR